jgi:3-oxoacyl-[acyl-carrier-protein] synthase-1
MSSAEVLEALYAGRSGLTTSSAGSPLPQRGFEAALGALPEAPPALPARFARYDTRLARIAHALFAEIEPALARAVRRHGASRVALVLASSTGGLETTERASAQLAAAGQLPEQYSFDHAHAFHALIDLMRAWSGAGGPGYVVSTACSSGNKVFGSAARLLQAGMADAVLVGGIDSLCQVTVRGFHSLGILSKQPCRPFGRDRAGTSIGEGGALLLLERGGEASAELLGVGECCDAHHMTQPAPDGSGALNAMQKALDAAGLEAAQIDHVNAHGTGTPLNDAAEARALASLFGRSVPVASTKGYTGHMLGAAAAIEAVFAVAALERKSVPRSLGSDPADPTLEIQLSARAHAHPCRYVLSNAFAFGGSNAAVVFGAAS